MAEPTNSEVNPARTPDPDAADLGDSTSKPVPKYSISSDDPRVYLAAERTFLAWIRTGLALMGFGFVVARFGLFLRELDVANRAQEQPHVFSVWTGTGLVLIGVMVNLFAALHHVRLVRALREGVTPLDRPSTLAISISVMLAVIGVGMAVYLVVIR
jgi:putative membrane protein